MIPPRDKPGPRARKGALTPEDRALWEHVAGQARPLARNRVAPNATTEGPPEPPAPPKTQGRKALRGAAAPRALLERPNPVPAAKQVREKRHGDLVGVDRRQGERLRRGRLPIEGRLDLHGLTQAQAHARLDSFLAGAQAAGKRCVLIVTGKGSYKAEGGVLKAEVPRWLNQAPNRERVLAFDLAQPKDGGSGALYVLLKRKRER